MNTAEQAEYKLKDNALLGCTWAKDVDYSFEWLLNEYISEVVSVDISRKVIDFKDGCIHFPSWSSKTGNIDIRFAVYPDGYETWKWITLKHKPSNEADARQFVKDNWTTITSKYKLHQFED